jgi:hypothetical protein
MFDDQPPSNTTAGDGHRTVIVAAPVIITAILILN